MLALRLARILTGSALVGLIVLGGATSGSASRDAGMVEGAVIGAGPNGFLLLAAAHPVPESEPRPVTPPAIESAPSPEPAGLPPPPVGTTGSPAPVSVALADVPIVEKLRELVTSKQLDRIVERKRERDAVVAFYAGRSFLPLWIENAATNARAKAALAHLAAAEGDGLDPADYATPGFKPGAEAGTLAEAELRLTLAVLTYARHAQTGRVHFSRISSEISYSLAAPEPGDVLTRMAEATNVGEALGSYNPPHAGYKALKAKLAEVRRQTGEAERPRIANGPLLKVGMQDERVPLLRKRLGIADEAGGSTYDQALAEAVKTFQRQRKLAATGRLNSATVDALNEPRRIRDVDVIIANMERWRWMPRDLGSAYSILNIPDFTLKVVRGETTMWRTKVVVGKVATPTPILSDTMKFITVNPTWNVPPSILNRQYLPALRRDPAVLSRMGIKVTRNRDGTIRMYQPPGERNALGRLRFNFPNKFLVYQHDTPDKHLFAREQRAYSNGCMRVQDPLKYADVLLSIALPKDGYTQERLRKQFGGAERNITFPAHIPVHLTYQTAFVDDAGKLVIRSDIYGYDGRIQLALRDNNRRFADIAVPNAHKHSGEPIRRRESARRPAPREAGGTPFVFGPLLR